jgi:hypothetical protein
MKMKKIEQETAKKQLQMKTPAMMTMTPTRLMKGVECHQTKTAMNETKPETATKKKKTKAIDPTVMTLT